LKDFILFAISVLFLAV